MPSYRKNTSINREWTIAHSYTSMPRKTPDKANPNPKMMANPAGD
jgi:hypothetical protein